jgi:hypothetical protein
VKTSSEVKVFSPMPSTLKVTHIPTSSQAVGAIVGVCVGGGDGMTDGVCEGVCDGV